MEETKEEIKKRLEEPFDIDNHPKRDLVFDIVWSGEKHGESNSYESLKSTYGIYCVEIFDIPLKKEF